MSVIAGYDGEFKFAIFIQAIALMSAQPLLLYKAQVLEHSSKLMLLYFIPVTILSTPLGQFVGDRLSTDVVELAGGFLIAFVALFELYSNRNEITSYAMNFFGKSINTASEDGRGGYTSDGMSNKSSDAVSMDRSNLGLSASVHDMFAVTNRRLGKGAVSEVMKGTCKQTHMDFAIKMIKKKECSEIEIERFAAEINILQELSHPNIISLVAHFDELEALSMVFEIMSGGDLFGRLEHVGTFHETEARNICASMLCAISYIHSKHIVHRDIKPENVLFSSYNKDAILKICDFGFAKQESVNEPDSFTTMCGTRSYMAPEIFLSQRYGLKVDVWSIGVTAYMLLCGYEPFHCDNEDHKPQLILNGNYSFEEKYWTGVSEHAKDFIASLLQIDPNRRLSAMEAQDSQWFSKKLVENEEDCSSQVFFMIGSQRSGSNWLRTLIDEREDIAAPHPPHIMRDFMPILGKYGDLLLESNYQVLVDHVCAFVERNQVPWTDRHGRKLLLTRRTIFERSLKTCGRLRRKSRSDSKYIPNNLSHGFYLLAIFDAIMSFYAAANGKRVWMCKSMGMSRYHDLLLDFYGEKRLRYIYLVRDPRDVAMSFMKTPVGDCHYYEITKKWVSLQESALRISKDKPDLLLQIHYEDLLADKRNAIKQVYDFLGVRRFGGIKRQASIIAMTPIESILKGAKSGRETSKAVDLSYQFKNLRRGSSFAKVQFQKWRLPQFGLTAEELQLIESLAHEVMEELGYDTSKVGVNSEPTIFSEEDIEAFAHLNSLGIQQMNNDLKVENPGDYERRKFQAEVLNFDLVLKGDWGNQKNKVETDVKKEATLLGELDLSDRLKLSAISTGQFTSGRKFHLCAGTQRGYYPNDHNKTNQDAFVCNAKVKLKNNHRMSWFSVFDGHGPDGHKCSEYVSNSLQTHFNNALSTLGSVKSAFISAHLLMHDHIKNVDDISTDLSGTTATTLLFDGDKAYVSNLGDSVCILGSCDTATDGRIFSSYKSPEHSLFSELELERIERSGGKVMSINQRDGIEPMHVNWTKDGDPPRLWADEENQFPGVSFTRSIGDTIAHSVGVTAMPEISELQIASEDRVFIIATDGITECK